MYAALLSTRNKLARQYRDRLSDLEQKRVELLRLNLNFVSKIRLKEVSSVFSYTHTHIYIFFPLIYYSLFNIFHWVGKLKIDFQNVVSFLIWFL